MKYARIVIAAVVALVLALVAGVLGGWAPFVVSVGMAVTTGVGWPAAAGIHARRRHNVLIAVAGTLACLLVQLVPSQRLVWLPAIIGVSFMAVCVAELVRGEGAEHRLESALASVTGVLAAVASSGWIAFSRVAHEQGLSGWLTVAGVGAPLTVILVVAGARVISAAPEHLQRRGMITLGVTPVALLGMVAVFASQVLASVVA
ncbi:hypothetical protein ACUW97_000315 [Kocuria rhizophila]|nr:MULTISPECIES: hypothetical protein [Kocuria]HBH55880.1 hypothetical protein [Kocuria sp.]ASE11110.2 hypothetical protein CEP81_05210 [Kocuria rhizophila]MBK4119552.1 hypothetical protein [Kocuria rhizophila]MCC5671116.1 hypothetical protein [Kocuria rhizophila]MCC5675286.1 hypothetical protein [Kocuria rhizophila]